MRLDKQPNSCSVTIITGKKPRLFFSFSFFIWQEDKFVFHSSQQFTSKANIRKGQLESLSDHTIPIFSLFCCPFSYCYLVCNKAKLEPICKFCASIPPKGQFFVQKLFFFYDSIGSHSIIITKKEFYFSFLKLQITVRLC